jgi:hypothetical protein
MGSRSKKAEPYKVKNNQLDPAIQKIQQSWNEHQWRKLRHQR